MVLNIEQYDDMIDYYVSSGLRVLLTEPSDSKVTMDTTGYSVAAGTHTTLRVSQTTVSKYRLHTGNCYGNYLEPHKQRSLSEVGSNLQLHYIMSGVIDNVITVGLYNQIGSALECEAAFDTHF